MEDKKLRIEKKRELTGVVTSDKMVGTVKVIVETPIKHPVYKKVVSRRKTFMASNDMDISVGDTVVIREISPKSKKVRWEVVKKLDK